MYGISKVYITILAVALTSQVHAADINQCRGFSRSLLVEAALEFAGFKRAQTLFTESQAGLLPHHSELTGPSALHDVGMTNDIHDAFPGTADGILIASSNTGYRAMVGLDLANKGSPSEFGALRIVFQQTLPPGSRFTAETAGAELMQKWRAAVQASGNKVLKDYFPKPDATAPVVYEMMYVVDHEHPDGFTVAISVPLEAATMSLGEFTRLISSVARGGLQAVN